KVFRDWRKFEQLKKMLKDKHENGVKIPYTQIADYFGVDYTSIMYQESLLCYRKDMHKNEVLTKNCRQCGGEFKTRRKQQVYCSYECQATIAKPVEPLRDESGERINEGKTYKQYLAEA